MDFECIYKFSSDRSLLYFSKIELFLLQAEVFPYPEIGIEELEEIKQLVAPVDKFFSEQGEKI